MSNIYTLYTDACKKGNIDKAKQIIDENLFILYNDGGDFALSWAVYYNHIELAEWLLTIDPNIANSRCLEDLFRQACRYGNIISAKYLYSINHNINISAIQDSAFISACRGGYIELAKWLLEINSNINMSAQNEFAFIGACCNGHIEMVQWLLSVNKNIQKYNINEGFLQSCKYGTIDISQLLYYESLVEADNEFYELCFILACTHNKLITADWLLRIKPTIDATASNEEAFIIARNKKYEQIVKWLITLNPYNYIVYPYERNIELKYAVRDKKEIKWLKRMVPILAYKSNTKNVFNNLNYDVVRNICEFI